MEKVNNKKKYYYQNNKNHYYKKNKKQEGINPKKTYDDIVNVRNDVSEIDNVVSSNSNSSLKMVMIAIMVLAIIFGSMLLFHLI